MPFFFMTKITITKNEAGQRLDKFLLKYLNEAPSSLIHKYLRKKDIRLNGARAQGNERLSEGDEILIRLPDGVISSLRSQKAVQGAYPHVHVIYEDDAVLILNKPAGVLSQQTRTDEVTLNEEMLSYLMDTGQVTQESLSFFKPSVCNRLDRNTSGIVLAAKTLPAAQTLGTLIRERKIRKFYRCLVHGELKEAGSAAGWLRKDTAENRVTIYDAPREGARPVLTKIRPLASAEACSLLEIELVTGKPHQIRAQLSALGHPIVSDAKYGGRSMYGIRYQALCACRVDFPQESGPLTAAAGKSFRAPLPADFDAALDQAGPAFAQFRNISDQ